MVLEFIGADRGHREPYKAVVKFCNARCKNRYVLEMGGLIGSLILQSQTKPHDYCEVRRSEF